MGKITMSYMVIFSKNNDGKFDEKKEEMYGENEKSTPEQELENLIIDNPNLVPVNEFSSES